MAKLISPKEVSLHSSLGDCWIIIEGRVYDVSEYMLRHPGGRWIILSNGGKDATEGFMHKIHSLDAL